MAADIRAAADGLGNLRFRVARAGTEGVHVRIHRVFLRNRPVALSEEHCALLALQLRQRASLWISGTLASDHHQHREHSCVPEYTDCIGSSGTGSLHHGSILTAGATLFGFLRKGSH